MGIVFFRCPHFGGEPCYWCDNQETPPLQFVRVKGKLMCLECCLEIRKTKEANNRIQARAAQRAKEKAKKQPQEAEESKEAAAGSRRKRKKAKPQRQKEAKVEEAAAKT